MKHLIMHLIHVPEMRFGNIIILLSIVLSGCATTPETVEVKVPVPVTVSCPQVPKPGMCVPKNDSRVEWLRCALIDRELIKAYVLELEQTLEACK